MKKVLICITLLLTFGQAHAGRVTSKVSFVQINNDGDYQNLVAIKFDDMPVDRPGCATDYRGRFAVLIDSESGMAIYSMALAAQASGKLLEVYGTGNCIGSTGIEEISYIRIRS